MKKLMNRFFMICVGAILLSAPYGASAQPGPEDPGCGPDGTYPDGTPCPIDGGLSLLIAAGIGIGAKKAYDRKKATQKIVE